MNFYRIRFAWILCLLPVVLAGCSTTMGSRFLGSRPSQAQGQPKALTVSGDRAVSIATGDPGNQAVVSADPEPKPNPKGRISGRVLDEQGEPVPNVTVRLADGGSKGGKDVRGTTDQTGAFTLNGLRPGSTYSLIAEADDDQGTFSGRARAKTSDSRVEITLLSDEAEAKASKKGRPAKALPISNREDFSDEPVEQRKPAINREDVELPADPVEPLDPGPTPPGDSGRPKLEPPVGATGWQNSKTSAARTRPRTDDSEAVATSADNIPRRSRVVNAGTTYDEAEEGPNPLPPAIEPGQDDDPAPRKPTSARLRPAARPKPKPQVKPVDSGDLSLAPETSAVEKTDPRRKLETGATEVAVAAELPNLAPVAGLRAESPPNLLPDPVETARVEPLPTIAAASGPPELPSIGGTAETPIVANAPPELPPNPLPTLANSASTTPASQPVFASQGPELPATLPSTAPSSVPAKPADYNPFALVAANPIPESTPIVTSTAPSSSTQLDRMPTRANPNVTEGPTVVADHDNQPTPVAEAPKTRWGDISTVDPPKPKVYVEPTKATFTSSIVKRFRPAPAQAVKADATVALCSYDARLRKIKDFRLPDLEGKPVRFQDFGSDFVLLDFWGTWCSPCLESIPHLVDLQKKYGPNRLTVVGIACEEIPPEKRKAKVEEVARKLGINYPVLLSTMDGKPCPVQQALAIQAMPTMILLNRKGEVVWRVTGSTPANEAKLDRILSTNMSWSDTARR